MSAAEDLKHELLNWKDNTIVLEVRQTADDIQQLMYRAVERIEELEQWQQEMVAKAAGKVTCATCDGEGKLDDGEWMPCPDCADLRRLLGEKT